MYAQISIVNPIKEGVPIESGYRAKLGRRFALIKSNPDQPKQRCEHGISRGFAL